MMINIIIVVVVIIKCSSSRSSCDWELVHMTGPESDYLVIFNTHTHSHTRAQTLE